MSLSYKFFHSPVGRLQLVASNIGLVALLCEDDNPERVRLDGVRSCVGSPAAQSLR